MATKEKRRSLRQKIQDFMSSPKGQVVMNYAYNWGASVVILGTLFKLTHLPGANFMLFAGMGTEVCIFFLSAFDMSAVKSREESASASAAGPVVLGGMPPVNMPAGAAMPQSNLSEEELERLAAASEASRAAGPSIVFVGGAPAAGPVAPVTAMPGAVPASADAPAVSPVVQPVASAATEGSQNMPPQPVPAQSYVAQPAPAFVPQTPVAPEVTSEMEEATQAYLEQLKTMTEVLARCSEQAGQMGDAPEQLTHMSQSLAGINAIYEAQLRSVSMQISTIDQVHEQTRRMAQQIEELNEMYARMLQAMQGPK